MPVSVPSKLSAPCPSCGGSAIFRTGNLYECADCHSALKVTITSRALWAIPTLAGMLAVFVLTVPLQRSGFLSGVWLAAIRGSLAALASALTVRVLIRGMKYRVLPQR
jgi:hypothetical protein